MKIHKISSQPLLSSLFYTLVFKITKKFDNSVYRTGFDLKASTKLDELVFYSLIKNEKFRSEKYPNGLVSKFKVMSIDSYTRD